MLPSLHLPGFLLSGSPDGAGVVVSGLDGAGPCLGYVCSFKCQMLCEQERFTKVGFVSLKVVFLTCRIHVSKWSQHMPTGV